MPKILLIEDDEEIRGLVQSVLEFDYEVLATASLDDAELCWMENRGNLNVVLSDLCLPDAKSTVSRVSGWQAESPGLQAVFVSGLLAAAVETEYGLVNGIDFLSKPFTISELRRIVGEAAVRCGMQSARAA